MKTQYESDFKINDYVKVTYGDAGSLNNCCVMGVHFRQGGHVFYDLAVLTHTDDDGTQNWQRLYKVPGGLINEAAPTAFSAAQLGKTDLEDLSKSILGIQ